MTWVDFISPQNIGINTNAVITVDGEEYPTTQIKTDLSTVYNIIDELDNLTDDLSDIIWQITTSDKEYVTGVENKESEYILFKFINARDALWNIVRFYRVASYPDANTRTQGASIAMLAGVNLNYYTTRLVALSVNNDRIVKILNAAHSKYEIPKGSYNKLFLAATDIDNISLIDTAWELFSKDIHNKDSQLLLLIDSDQQHQETLYDLQEKYFEAYMQTRYILFVSGKIFPNIENRLRHSPIRSLEKKAGRLTADSYYSLHGSVFKNVSRIKNPTVHILTFTDEQVKQIKSLVEPGDIILTYTAGYMSNVFLPGTFKHGITYIGNVQQRTDMGLTKHKIKKHTISDKQYSCFTNNMAIAEHPKGYEANVIEAVSEGVIMNSLDYLLKTHINRMLILRPKISDKERIKQLAILFNYIGTPYDFNFNFSDDTHQCCTELIYRALNNKGNIDLSFGKMKGKWVLTADNIVNYHLETPATKFDVILLVDSPKESTGKQAVIFTGQAAATQLQKLMK